MRTFNSARNAVVSIGYLAVKTLLEFVLRTIFIKMLDSTYLGVNGLFSDILMILNLAELGVGNAIIFNLYKPVAEKDTEKIKTLMAFYRKCYYTIASVILVAGLCLMPFLEHLIKYDGEAISHIHFIFLLYLLNSSLSYLAVYKSNLIVVNQKNYILNLTNTIFEIGLVIVQGITLLVFKNFYLYLFLLMASTITCNFVKSAIAQKMYPEELRYKGAEKLEKNEKKHMLKDVYSLMLYRIGDVILNGTSSVILSSFIGIGVVGIYSNYVLVINAARKVLINIFNSVVASVGNLNADEKNKERSLEIYYQMNFIAFILYGFCAVAIFCLVQHFINWWIGDGYLLPIWTVVLIVANLYIYGLNSISTMYRNTLGLFVKGRYRPLVGAVFNIAFSIYFAKTMGITGVFLSTVLTNLVTTSWYDPRMILKYGFGLKPWRYFANMGYYIVALVSIAIASSYIISFIPQTSFLILFVDLFIVTAIFGGVVLLFFGRTKEFKGLISTVKVLFKRKK